MSFNNTLETILNESDGETVSSAIASALSELKSSIYKTADISDEISSILTEPKGRELKKAVHDALYKLSISDIAGHSSITVLTQDEYDSLSSYDDTFYGIMDKSLIYILSLNDDGTPSTDLYYTSLLREASTFFSSNTSGKYYVNIGADLGETELEESLFYGATALHSITIPDGFTTIKLGCFASSGLSEIDLPDSLATIGEGAFSNTVLSSIEIPSNVETIGENAFSDCDLLSTIRIHKKEDSILGSPWGATNAEIIWNG